MLLLLKIGHKTYPNYPFKLLVFNNKIFAIRLENVSVICQPFDDQNCRPLHDIMIKHPMTAAATTSHIYIVNGSSVKLVPQHGIGMPTVSGNGTVSVINPHAKCDMTIYTVPCDTMEHDIPVGKEPLDIVVGEGKYYVSNNGSNTVSVIDVSTSTKKPDIPVGIRPTKLAYDANTNMIYVVNRGNVSQPTLQKLQPILGQPIPSHFNPFSSSGPGTVSVIDGSSDKVAAGVIFSVNPANSGRIICNGAEYPTNIYLYVDAGTICTAQPNKDFEFNTWVENLPINRNSTIPLSSSGNLTVNRYGMFTVNFKQPHQLSSRELFTYLTGAISAGVAINGAILIVPGWRRARKQRTNLKQCIKMIDDDVAKSDKNAIEKKILGYYVEGKLSEDHRQLLKDKISEYYEEKAE